MKFSVVYAYIFAVIFVRAESSLIVKVLQCSLLRPIGRGALYKFIAEKCAQPPL